MTRTNRQKRLRAAAKGVELRPGCPSPAKKAYENAEAVHKALRSSKFIGRPVSIYTCACGALHLTKRKQK